MSDQVAFYIGVGAGVCTAISLLPQLIKLIKEKKADGLSYGMYLILLTGVGGWIVYGWMKKDIPVIVTNSFSFAINILMIAFTFKYKK